MLWILLIAVLLLILPRIYTILLTRSTIFNIEHAPNARVAIVFGAGLFRDGSPSTVLKDRVKAAADLYFAGKIEKILMSGDNRFVYYNEPGAMQEYASGLGVPAEDIILDYAGRRTYDTCYRAIHIFGVRDALLVTQQFHLPRALFICNTLGVKSVGIRADQRQYFLINSIREFPATLMALWEVWISKPLPVLRDPEPIFPEPILTESESSISKK